jgi:hypothetical protein
MFKKNRITTWQPPLKEIDALKAKTANKNEAGIVQKKLVLLSIWLLTANELNMPPGTDFIGSMHTHQTLIQVVGFGKMELNNAKVYTNFSPTDIVQFFRIFKQYKTKQCSTWRCTAWWFQVLHNITIYWNIDKVRSNFDILDLNNKYLKVKIMVMTKS